MPHLDSGDVAFNISCDYDREQMARARVDVAAHLRSRGLPRPSIGRSDNSGQPVDDDELWRHLRNL